MGLDGVEIVLAVEEAFGIAIPDADAAEMITPAMMIAYVQEAVGSRADTKACISQRAFHRVRAGLIKATGVERSMVTLDTKIKTLFSGPRRSEMWKAFQDHTAIGALPPLHFGTGWLFSPKSVNELVSIALSQSASGLRKDRSWTNEEVRQIIRQIISDQLGVKRFRDSDEFVKDLGVD